MPKFFSVGNFVSWSCGRAVERQRINIVQLPRLIHSTAFCTHFVRRLWVRRVHYAQLIRSSKPQAKDLNQSVTAQLYPLSTGLTIKTSFLNLTY